MLSITLTTGWSPGDNDPGKTYPKCALTNWNVNRTDGTIDLRARYGDFSEGVWVSGSSSPSMKHQLQGNDFNNVIAAVSEAGSECYVTEVERRLLQWLLDQNIVSGTIS